MSFTLNGIKAEDLGIIFLRNSQRPLLPSTRDMTIALPGRNGAWDFGADVEPKEFELECGFITQDGVELQMYVERLARLLVDSYGKPRSLKLSFSYRPDREYTVRYSGDLEIERIYGVGKFTIPFKAYDPYPDGQERVFEEVITDNPHSISIESDGELRSNPKIVLTNEGTTTITNFRLTNEYRVE